MTDDEKNPYGRPDGHRYSKSWDYAILGILVAVLLVLVATGVVPIFDF